MTGSRRYIIIFHLGRWSGAASLLDALWFLGLGYGVSAVFGNVTEMPAAARVVGAAAFLVAVAFLIGRNRKCALPHSRRTTLATGKRGTAFVVACVIKLLPWETLGRLAKRVGIYDKPEYRIALSRAVAAAQAGDLILVGRKSTAPWGIWSHIGMVVETPAGPALLHAFEGDVRLTAVSSYPMCGKVCVVRIHCTEAQRQTIVAAAWSQLGKPFRLGRRKPGCGMQNTFNCIGLVDWAFAQGGVLLTTILPGEIIVPDDVLDSNRATLVFAWGVEADEAPGLLPATLLKVEGNPPEKSGTTFPDLISDHQLCRLIANIWYCEAIWAAPSPHGVCVDFYPSPISENGVLTGAGVTFSPRESRPELNWKLVWGDNKEFRISESLQSSVEVDAC